MISEFMLKDSAVAKIVTGRTADRKPMFSDEVILSKIYVDVSRSTAAGTNGKTEADRGTLYFDCKNSRPSDFTPVKDMVIIFDDVEFTVSDFKKCKGLQGLEHYEIGLK